MELGRSKQENRRFPFQGKATPVILDPTPFKSAEKVNAALRSYIPAIGIMDAQLKETVAQIEEAVVEVCSSFQGISERARASVAKTTTFLTGNQQAYGENVSIERLIEECQTTMEGLLTAIGHAGEVSRKAVEQMRLIDEYSSKISTALKQLDNIAEGNKILAINARIEAAHAGEAGAGFAVVANEVNEQAQKSRDVITQVSDLSVQLRNAARSAVKDLEIMDRQDRKSATQSSEQVTAAFHEFQSMHSRMKEMLADMSREGELLAADISNAIHGLQFQDRSSQRIAHVREGLETLRLRLDKIGNGEVIEDTNIANDLMHYYTMHEERTIAGIQDHARPGEVEIF